MAVKWATRLLAAVAAVLAAGPALACLACLGPAERTLADHLLEDAVLVLARPGPGATLVPVETLRGEAEAENSRRFFRLWFMMMW